MGLVLKLEKLKKKSKLPPDSLGDNASLLAIAFDGKTDFSLKQQ
jgi:hypothetical protein